MSATRDKTQNVAFVYKNLYQVYQQTRQGSPHVLKTEDIKKIQPQIRPYEPVQLMGKRVETKRAEAKNPPQVAPIDSLKQNLDSLNQLHSRLKFMLKELEDLVKDEES